MALPSPAFRKGRGDRTGAVVSWTYVEVTGEERGEMKIKPSKINKFTRKHDDFCAVHISSGDGHCSCGRNSARSEVAKLKNVIRHIKFSFTEDGQIEFLTKDCTIIPCGENVIILPSQKDVA
jgi:hypothetical protein